MHDAEKLELLDVGYTIFRVARTGDEGQNGLVFAETHHLTRKEGSALKKSGFERLVCIRLPFFPSLARPYALIVYSLMTILVSSKRSTDNVSNPRLLRPFL